MKKISILILSLCVIVILLPSCSKKKGCTDPVSVNYDADAEKDDGSCEYAGTGGQVEIAAFPQHHGVEIVSDTAYLDTAYVKFNVQEFPGDNPAAYDLIIAGEPGENHVHIENLKKGKYYIFMAGYDPSIHMRVRGGIPYTVNTSSGELDVNVPVGEE